MFEFCRIPIEIAKNILANISFFRHFKERVSRERLKSLQDIYRPIRLFEDLISRSHGRLDLADKVVLEVGPGNSMGMGLLFLAHGAKRVYLVDRFKHIFWDDYDAIYYRNFLSEISNQDVPNGSIVKEALRIKNGKIILNPDLLEYRLGDAARIPLEDSSVDFLFSNAVLEHVRHVELAVQEFARVTKEAGLNVHEVDLRDHFFSKKPLRLLSYSDWLWDFMTCNRPAYSNRLRFSDYCKMFESNKFVIERLLYTRTIEQTQVTSLKLSSKFKKYPWEELSILAFWVFLKRKCRLSGSRAKTVLGLKDLGI